MSNKRVRKGLRESHHATCRSLPWAELRIPGSTQTDTLPLQECTAWQESQTHYSIWSVGY